jgi:hypothetical protein
VPWGGELPPRDRGRVYATPEDTHEIERLEITLVDWDIYERYGSVTREHEGCASDTARVCRCSRCAGRVEAVPALEQGGVTADHKCQDVKEFFSVFVAGEGADAARSPRR